MKLPNAERAIVDERKIEDYLLNTRHRYGASKARFFKLYGFTTQTLLVALRDHAKYNSVAREFETGFGPRYVVQGPLPAPDGRAPTVCTVWQIDHGNDAPRLITAYPAAEDI